MATKKLLLVDTNIISHALSPLQTQHYVELFKELEKEYIFIVTGFTKYELLRNSDKEHKQGIQDYLAQNMSLADLSNVLIEFSSRIYYLYRNYSETKNKTISDGDIINAAFSIAKNCSLLTIDNTDYPRVFFEEKSRHHITYISRAGKEHTDVLFILHPDMSKLKECFEQHQA